VSERIRKVFKWAKYEKYEKYENYEGWVLLNIQTDVQQTGRGGASLNVSFDV